MADEGKIISGLKAAKELAEAVPAYQDAMQPAAKEFGEAAKPAGRDLGDAVAILVKTVNAALDPLRAFLWGYDQIRQLICDEVAQRFKDKPERLDTPNWAVAGPAIEALRFTASEPTLREMYMNLLAASMDKETAHKAHPAFVETIKQLTPDEARIVRLLYKKKELPTVYLFKKVTLGYRQLPEGEVQFNFSLITDQADCQHPELLEANLDNLCRLQLATKAPFDVFLGIPELYAPLVDDPRFRKKREQFETEWERVEINKGYFSITAFGLQFCETCIVGTEPVRTADQP